MVDYIHSSQNNDWHFQSQEELQICRTYTNYRARQFMYDRDMKLNNRILMDGNENTSSVSTTVPNTTSSSGEISPIPSTATSSTALLAGKSQEWSTITTTMIKGLPVSCYACNLSERNHVTKDRAIQDYTEMGPWYGPNDTKNKNRYLSSEQEMILIHFYAKKIPNIIGPNAEIKRLRRESKVVATATMLYNRFFICNSIHLFDPKMIMVASTFLACKVEDVTADIRYIEQATQLLNAPVTISDIVTGEIYLLSGLHYNLLCFHSYKSTLAITEDLRTFLKTTIGQQAFTVSTVPTITTTTTKDDTINNDSSVTGSNETKRPVQLLTGQDLKPIYDIARTLLDFVIVSDIPMLYSPGQIGIAALTVAHNEIMKQNQQILQKLGNTDQYMDILSRVYIPARFATSTTTPKTTTTSANTTKTTSSENVLTILPNIITNIANMIRTLQKENNEITNQLERYMTDLKAIHKVLKKVRLWGQTSNSNNNSDTKNNEKKKSKKRALVNESVDGTIVPSKSDNTNDDTEHPNKRIKTE